MKWENQLPRHTPSPSSAVVNAPDWADERDRPGLRRRMRKLAFNRERRHQQAEAVGRGCAADAPHRGERGLRQRPALLPSAWFHAGGKHDCRLGAAAPVSR